MRCFNILHFIVALKEPDVFCQEVLHRCAAYGISSNAQKSISILQIKFRLIRFCLFAGTR